MRLIFSIFTAIVVIAAALFFVGPLLISTDEVRDQLLAQVESATGYRLRVDGPVKFSLFPSLNLVAKDVGVAQRGSSGIEMATAKELRFGLIWSALWGGKVQLTEVTLIDPVITMPAKAAQAQAGAEGAATTEQAGSDGRSAAATLQNLTLDKLVIENGTVILPASANTQGKRIDGLNLEASLPSFDSPLSFDAKAVYDGKPVEAAGSIGNFGSFLEGTPAPVSLAIESPAHLDDKATVTGTAAYQGDTFTFNQFTAKSGAKSLTGNATYQNEMLTLSQFTAQAFDAVLAGNATYKGSILTLHPFTAQAYGSTFSGSLAANLAGKIPAVNIAATTDTLDLNKVLSGSGARRAAVDSERRMLADASGAIGSTSSSKRSSSAGRTAGSGWSDAKIDFTPLKAVNAKLKLTAKQLIYGTIKIDPGTLQATLTDGKLNAELPNFTLYNGVGAASCAVDASGSAPSQRVKLSLSKLDAYPFLNDVAGFQNIEGTGAITLDLAANGASQRAMVQTLSGSARFDFTNGAIRGINVAKTIRALSKGTLSGWQDSAAEKTDFATLGASFNLAAGQAHTEDLQLVGPLVRMNGAGTINLPARTLQLRVDPKIVASLEGQGGQTDLQGLGVPVVIAGPWASPRIYPDIKGILENPVAAYEQLNKLNQLGGGLVKLPSVDQLGEKAGVPLSNIIKDGKIDRDALQQGAIEGLGQLLNKQSKPKPAPPTAVTPTKTDPAAVTPADTEPAMTEPEPEAQPAPQVEPAETASENPPAEKAQTHADRKKQRKKEQKREAEEAAKQLLQNLFGN